MSEDKLGPWTITFDPPPIPDRSMDWHFWHEDDDEESHERSGSRQSREACLIEIAVLLLEEVETLQLKLKAKGSG